MWLSKTLRRDSIMLVKTYEEELRFRGQVNAFLSSLFMTISSATSIRKKVKSGTCGFIGCCELNDVAPKFM